MLYTDNGLNILTTESYKGIGKAWIVKNSIANNSIDDILKKLNKNKEEMITFDDFNRRKENIKQNFKKIKDYCDGMVTLGDDNFPKHRGIVKNSEKPIAIFYKGNIKLLKNKNIAVIGLLEPDQEIENYEKQVVKELIKHEVTIVSGLALGCDTIAHEQALNSNGKTIAILPCSLKEIIPKSNIKLAKQIIEKNGLLITEYYESMKNSFELKKRYQERDRLQALFSDGIILAASYAKNEIGNDSGSRLAMGYAKQYSIPQAVIYNEDKDKNNPKYDLNKQLINEIKNIIVIKEKDIALKISEILQLQVPKNEEKKADISDQRTLF